MTNFHLFITILGAVAFAENLFAIVDRIEGRRRK